MDPTTAPTTNATDLRLASTLSEIGGLGEGTLASLILRKQGVARGPASAPTIYDDDFVHVLLWTGFHYRALVERSLQKLQTIWGSTPMFQNLLKAAQDAGHVETTLQDVGAAISELDDALRRVLGTGKTQPSDPDSPESEEEAKAPTWEPLVVDGVTVKGAKVYVGTPVRDSPRGPTKGTVYIDGVKLGETVLEPAKNGHWCPRQKAKTVVKEILRSWLPIGLYARYRLGSENMLVVKVGAEASEHAKKGGVVIEPEAIRSLFKIAV
jgi:hypothetical protein